MSRLIDDIGRFLKDNGFRYSTEIHNRQEVIRVHSPHSILFPVEISALTEEDAYAAGNHARLTVECIEKAYGEYPMIITEDRWRKRKGSLHQRLMAHLGRHSQAYARNCEVRRIDKAAAAAFLNETHSYGDAACKYRYGLFLKCHSGHTASLTDKGASAGDLIAVASFSGARRWKKGDIIIRSYEWIRYASLPGMRVSGGMGKLLQAFIRDVRPDDIMSYADLEWSKGDVYGMLGFEHEGNKDPVLFEVDTDVWERHPVRSAMKGNLCFQNFGSRKYRLKITGYQETV